MKRIFAAALIAALLISCDFVGTDMFPRELQYAAGGYDLAAELGIEPDKIGEMRIERLVSSNGASGIFTAVKRPEGWRLFVLDDDMKSSVELNDPGFSPFLGSYSFPNNFICGTTSISEDFGIYAPATYNGCKHNSIDIAGTVDIFNQQDVLLETRINMVDKIIGTEYGTYCPIMTDTYFDLLDGSTLVSASEHPRPFILARMRGASVNMVALRFPDIAVLPTVFTGAPLSENVDVAKTWLFVEEADGGWVTEDGIVVLSHHDDTRLIRFNLITGAELDSIKIESDWMQGISFDDSGEHWYYYDRRSGYLKKLRTWW